MWMGVGGGGVESLAGISAKSPFGDERVSECGSTFVGAQNIYKSKKIYCGTQQK